MASTAVGTEGEEDQMGKLSAYIEQLTEEGREAGRSLIKREKSTWSRADPCKTSQQTRKKQKEESKLYITFLAFHKLRCADSMYIYHYTFTFKLDVEWEQCSTSNYRCPP